MVPILPLRPRTSSIVILIFCISSVRAFLPVQLHTSSTLVLRQSTLHSVSAWQCRKKTPQFPSRCSNQVRSPFWPLARTYTSGSTKLNSLKGWLFPLIFGDASASSDAPCTIVTGGNRGIGLALARHVGLLGHKVIIACRLRDAGKEAEEVLRREGIDVMVHQLDVTNRSEIRSLVQQCATSSNGFRMPSFVFNNAGVCIEGASLETLQESMAVNYWGAVHMIESLLALSPPLDSKSNSSPPIDPKPTVINISSGEGELVYLCTELQHMLSSVESVAELHNLVRGLTNGTILAGTELAYGPTPAYSVSKAALNAFTRIVGSSAETPGLEAAKARDRMRIVAVCPGDVDTRMSSDW